MLKASSSSLAEAVDDEFYGSWFANLLYLDRRECILFTNSRTLYSFAVLGVKKADLAFLGQIFSEHLMRSMRSEAVKPSFLAKVERSLCEVIVARTNNKSVLGSMNDLLVQLKTRVWHQGGVLKCDMVKLNKELNRIPMGAIGYSYAVDKLLELDR